MVLGTLAERMAEKIRKKNIGAMATTDDDADGYYIIEFTSEAYTLQHDIELDEYTPAVHIAAGELVCEALYRNKVQRARGWYTKPSTPLKTIVRVQQVVAANLHLEPISATNKLPNTCDKPKATKLKAEKLTDHDNDVILEEIDRRERIEHDELEDDEDEDESEDEADEDEDGEDDGANA